AGAKRYLGGKTKRGGARKAGGFVFWGRRSALRSFLGGTISIEPAFALHPATVDLDLDSTLLPALHGGGLSLWAPPGVHGTVIARAVGTAVAWALHLPLHLLELL